MQELEFDFKKQLLIEECIQGINCSFLRNVFNNDSFGLAQSVAEVLRDNGVLASAVTFAPKNLKEVLNVTDEINNCTQKCGKHAVVLLGNAVLDVLYTNEIKSTNKFISDMLAINEEVMLIPDMTEIWLDADGCPMALSMENLKTM